VSLLGISADAWSAAAGAVVGGSFTLFGQITNDRNQAKTARQAAEDQAAATAILLQDDFWHYQAMLARALDRCTWWKPSELLPAQATIDDRKTIFAALPDEQTNLVAAAQGWIDYLIGTRQTMTDDLPALSQEFATTMQMTVSQLEQGRAALAKLARRPASAFSDSRVLDELDHCKTVEQLLSRHCNEQPPAQIADHGR
jgi:hypothetical protein